jgi:hypothetical protein
MLLGVGTALRGLFGLRLGVWVLGCVSMNVLLVFHGWLAEHMVLRPRVAGFVRTLCILETIPCCRVVEYFCCRGVDFISRLQQPKTDGRYKLSFFDNMMSFL